MNNSVSFLIEKFGLIISRVCHRMIKDDNIAKEAAQEVWYEVVKSIGSFRGDSDISTWIFTIAHRTIVRYARHERVYKSIEINNHFEPGEIEHDNEYDKLQWIKDSCDYCLTAFCHCLNNDARLIFLFREIAELSFEQISEIMEISEENTRKILSRSREKVRNFMKNDCILYNPEGNCRCRIKKHILQLNLQNEYRRLSKAADLIKFYQKFDKELPRKNYWEEFMGKNVTK